MNTQRMTNVALWCAALGLAGLVSQGCGSPQEKGERMESRVDETMKDAQQEIADKQEKAYKDLADEKRELYRDLRSLRSDIDDRIQNADDKLATKDLKASEREEWNAYRAQLLDQRRRVEKALDDVGDADTNTWSEVKAAVQRSREDVDTWLEREAEKVDKKTKADADKDGH